MSSELIECPHCGRDVNASRFERVQRTETWSDDKTRKSVTHTVKCRKCDGLFNIVLRYVKNGCSTWEVLFG